MNSTLQELQCEFEKLRVRQEASEAVLIGVTALLFAGNPDAEQMLLGIRHGFVVTAKSADEAKQMLTPLQIDEAINVLVDRIQQLLSSRPQG